MVMGFNKSCRNAPWRVPAIIFGYQELLRNCDKENYKFTFLSFKNFSTSFIVGREEIAPFF